MYQMKEQDKAPEKQLNEVEIGNLPEKEFRIMIVKITQDLIGLSRLLGWPKRAYAFFPEYIDRKSTRLNSSH